MELTPNQSPPPPVLPDVILDRSVRYRTVRWRRDSTGWIMWRYGTGGNVELTDIHTTERGKGHGRQLFYVMLDALRADPPYYSVFGFTRVSNEEARAFYAALGFRLHEVPGVYADGRAVLFEAPYADLVREMERCRAA